MKSVIEKNASASALSAAAGSTVLQGPVADHDLCVAGTGTLPQPVSLDARRRLDRGRGGRMDPAPN